MPVDTPQPAIQQKYLKGDPPLIRLSIQVPHYVPESALNLVLHRTGFHFDALGCPRWPASVDRTWMRDMKVHRVPRDITFVDGKFVIHVAVIPPERSEEQPSESAAEPNGHASEPGQKGKPRQQGKKGAPSEPVFSWKTVSEEEQMKLAQKAASQTQDKEKRAEAMNMERRIRAKSKVEQKKKQRRKGKEARAELINRAETNVRARRKAAH